MTTPGSDETGTASGVPDWLDPEAWAAFKQMRKAKGQRAPLTPLAEKRILFELDLLRAKGHPPADVLWQSTVRGWAGVFPLKHIQESGTVESIETAQTRKLLADQAAHRKASTSPKGDVKAKLAATRAAILTKGRA